MKKTSFFFTLILGMVLARKVLAFPDMIRHGYVNCMACHNSSQGGDLLTPYGRELSKEVLSQANNFDSWNSREILKTPEWLNLGANMRLLQTFSESSVASRGRFMIMQAEVDALANLNDTMGVYLSIGRLEANSANAEWKDFVYFPRLWFQYQWQDAEGSKTAKLRLGRFLPVYGVLIPEHTYSTRQYLGFGPGQERQAADIYLSNEDYQFSLTRILAKAQGSLYENESGWVTQLSRVYGKAARAGISFYRTKSKNADVETKTEFEGLFLLMGWQLKNSILFQIDRIHAADGKTGIVDLIKYSYEYIRGLELFITQEYHNADKEKTDPHFEAYGIGAEYFPTANLDLFLTFKEMKDSSQLDEFQRQLWLIGHIYF